jgi:hypothetical protein
MKFEITTGSKKELEKFLAKELKKGNENMDKVLKLTTKHIQGQAKQLAPTGEYPNSKRVGGWLKKNIITKKVGNAYEVQSNADYSLWVEYGNRWWKGVSFFRPAIKNGYKFLEKQIKNI